MRCTGIRGQQHIDLWGGARGPVDRGRWFHRLCAPVGVALAGLIYLAYHSRW